MLRLSLTSSVGWIGRGLRELVLILAVGVLGSQLLIALNGGVPLGTTAQASASIAHSGRVVINTIDFELNPSTPTSLNAVHVSASTLDGSPLETLQIAFAHEYETTYACSHKGFDSWECPTRGVSVVELDGIFAAGS